MIFVYLQQASSNTRTIIKTIPSSMLSMPKAGSATVTTQAGSKTIVIAAPKGSTAGLSGSQHKILSSMPKLSGTGNTQFIVVSPQSSQGISGSSVQGKLDMLIIVDHIYGIVYHV